MVAIRARLRDWIQGIENTVLWHLVNWIVARRGVEFVYWVNPDSWEKYMSEPMPKELTELRELATQCAAIVRRLREQCLRSRSNGIMDYDLSLARQMTILTYEEIADDLAALPDVAAVLKE